MAETPPRPVTVDRLITAYIRIRDELAAKRSDFDEYEKMMKGNLSKIENTLLKIQNEQGVTRIATEAGTAYLEENIMPTGSDWNAFYAYVQTTGNFDALEKRIKKGFVKEYMEAHEGAPPPGVSVHREYVVRIRRS